MLYGGDIEEEVSDTVALISESAILEVITQYNSEDFSAKRNEIQYQMFLEVQRSLKDYYITLKGVFVINQEFVASQFSNAITDIDAEKQRIEEKSNLLEGEKIIAQTNIELATLDGEIAISNVTLGSNFSRTALE